MAKKTVTRLKDLNLVDKFLFDETMESRECPDLKLLDGAVRIFINTKGRNREDFSEEFLDFMEYVTDSSGERADRTKSKKIKLIHKQVQAVKESEKMGVKYMQRWEELAEARDEGRTEGHSAGLAEGHSAGLAEGHSAGLAEGHSAGLIEGCAEGEEKKLIRMVCKKLCKGKRAEEVVKEFTEEFEEDAEEIEKICKAAEGFVPECDYEGIYKKLHERQDFVH